MVVEVIAVMIIRVKMESQVAVPDKDVIILKYIKIKILALKGFTSYHEVQVSRTSGTPEYLTCWKR